MAETMEFTNKATVKKYYEIKGQIKSLFQNIDFSGYIECEERKSEDIAIDPYERNYKKKFNRQTDDLLNRASKVL